MTATHARICVNKALALLSAPDAVFEIRIPEMGRGRTDAGYFRDPTKVAAAVARYDGKFNIYITLNEPKAEVYARCADRIQESAKQTTSDREIARRRAILVDLDPERVAGISSTDAQHEESLERAYAVRDWLLALGSPGESLIVADSGNGGHVLILIDLPNDEASTDLVKRCLLALDIGFSDEAIHVDLTTFNAGRVTKLYGTVACKGDDIPERPHRRSRILDAPEQPAPAPQSLLERLAAFAPEADVPNRQGYRARATDGQVDVDAFIAEHGLDLAFSAAWHAGGPDAWKWVLHTCPFNPDHTNKSALIGQFANGAVFFRCLHNGCSGKGWRELRALYEGESPSERSDESSRSGSNGSAPFEAAQFDGSASKRTQQAAWPEPPGEAAFAGLAGRVVRCIDPYTEADPIGVLVQFVLAFGNLIDGGPHARVGAGRHPARENAILVGPTAKARKGESWSPVQHLLQLCEPAWAAACIKSGLSTGEGLIWAVRDPIYKTEAVREKGHYTGEHQEIMVDPGVDDKRLLVLEPEFGRVLRVMTRQGSTLSSVLRQAWDTGDLRIMTKQNAATATGAHISVVGHITCEELTRELTDTESVNGFANRFLWICVRRSKELPEPAPFESEEIGELADILIRAAYSAHHIGRLERDGDARELWASVYSDLSAGKPGLAGAILGRAEAHVLRLSLLYALLDQSPVVRAEHLESAIELWGYVERSVLYIFGDATGNPVADTILKALRQNGTLTRTQISELFGRHESSARIAQALQVLLTAGKVRCTQESSGGRPIEVWYPV